MQRLFTWDGDYQCDKCYFVAIKREELKSHVEAVHRDGYYQCDKWNFAAVINKNKNFEF